MQGRCRLLAGEAEAIVLEEGPWRALYLEKGSADLDYAGTGPRPIEAGTGRALGRGAISVRPNGTDTRFWLWEIDAQPERLQANLDGLNEVLTHDLDQTPILTGPTLVLRLERVDLHLGAQTPVHTHAGPGLRVLVAGRLEAEVGDQELELEPGDAWLERGPGEPVVGRSDPHQQTAFVRLMLLPEDMAGKDSFVHWNEAATERARPASYQRFFEERVTL